MRDLKKYSLSYDALEFEDEMVRFRRQTVLSRCSSYAPNRVLEVGCGKEPLFLHLAEHMNVTVVEPTFTFYQNAKSLSQDYSNATVLNATLEDADIEGYFDVIVVGCLLHEIENRRVFLEKIRALCSKNTVVHINVPNALSMHRKLAVSMGLISNPYEISETQKIMQQMHMPFDQNSLVNLLEEHGFKVCERGGYFMKPFTHSQMMQLLDNELLNENMLQGLYKLGIECPDLAAEIWVDCKKINSFS